MFLGQKNANIVDMSIKKILTTPNEILTTKSTKVVKFDEETKTIIKDLLDTAVNQKDPEAAGLAAPQIGHNKRIILVRDFKYIEESEKFLINNIVMINPRIISLSREKALDWESCLSIPYMYGQVMRSTHLKVNYHDENGAEKRLKARDFLARVIQHEVDHLDGVLFTDKLVGKLITEKEYNKLIEQENE